MPDYSDWEFIFQKSWDVVTGEIPGDDFINPDEPFASDPLNQLAVIIRKSRDLLGLDYFIDDLEEVSASAEMLSAEMLSSHDVGTYHKALKDAAKQAPDLTPGYLCIIREIFGSTRSIYQYLDYYKYGPGFTTNNFSEKAIGSARDIVPKETPGYVILAVLAIKEAFHQAKSLVQYDDKPETAKALNLLREAERLAFTADLDDIEAELEDKESKLEIIQNGRIRGGSQSKRKRGIDLHILHTLRNAREPRLVNRDTLYKGIPFCVDDKNIEKYSKQYIEIEDEGWTFKISRDHDGQIQHEAINPEGKMVETLISKATLYDYLKRVRKDWENNEQLTLVKEINWTLKKDE